MNKFKLLNDITPTEDYLFKLGQAVILKQNWRLLPHQNILAQSDPYLDDQDTFKIIHIYDKNFIHIQSISSRHSNIVHRDWIEPTSQSSSAYRIVTLKRGWEKETKFSNLKEWPTVTVSPSTTIKISAKEFGRYHLGLSPLIEVYHNDILIIRDLIEPELIEQISYSK